MTASRAPRVSPRFAIATRDELRVRGRVVERRLSHGEAFDDGDGIVASDARDDSLVAACDAEMERLREIAPDADRVRLVAEATLDGTTATLTIAIGGLSVVSTPADVARDYELLRTVASIEPAGDAVGYRGIPIVWRHGSAAVLLHEAAGHPAEHRHEPIGWPSWLSVRDGDADLLAGDTPSALRRATFRDVPLRRMTDLRVTRSGAALELPERRIEVLLVAGGAYDPLTEVVTVDVAAADLIEEGAARRLPPFTIDEPRRRVAQSIAAAEGEPIRYPGVICSREGQELVVGSSAPVMLTVFR